MCFLSYPKNCADLISTQQGWDYSNHWQNLSNSPKNSYKKQSVRQSYRDACLFIFQSDITLALFAGLYEQCQTTGMKQTKTSNQSLLVVLSLSLKVKTQKFKTALACTPWKTQSRADKDGPVVVFFTVTCHASGGVDLNTALVSPFDHRESVSFKYFYNGA